MRKAKVWDARQLPAYLTVAQYGELMGICPKTVRRMCQRGELPAHKEGPRLRRIDKNAALEQRQETMELCDYTVKIPMAQGVESLNVAAASAVAFWELGKI